jgi:hypothetical protein
MSHFADPEGFAGRLGALSAFGPTLPGVAWTFPIRFGAFRFAYLIGRSYESLDEIQELFALRWTLISLPGIQRRYLLFETIFIDDWESYLNLLVLNSHFGINAHSIGLSGYPGVKRVSVFMQYLAERHRVAIHLYTANPAISIRDIRVVSTANADARATWMSVVVPVPADRVGKVRDVADQWSEQSSINSGFRGAKNFVHHGRMVLLQEEGSTFLLISLVHVAGPGTPAPGTPGSIDRRFKRNVRSSDTAVLLDLIGVTAISEPWADLFSAIGQAFPNPNDAITWVLSKRTGVRRRDSIRYVDAVWGNSPTAISQRF